jgi:hypothetical protein
MNSGNKTKNVGWIKGRASMVESIICIKAVITMPIVPIVYKRFKVFMGLPLMYCKYTFIKMPLQLNCFKIRHLR